MRRKPFQPVASECQLTNTLNIKLHCENRAKQRAEFERDREEKQRQKMELTSKLEKQKQLKDENERKKLRKMLVHKANPIRAFKCLQISPSSAPMTVPKSPTLHVEKRAKLRRSLNDLDSSDFMKF